MKIQELSSPIRAVIVAALMALIAWPAVVEFRAQATIREPIVPGPGVTKVKMLSDWHAPLKGTPADTEVYFLEGREPGGTMLIAPSHAAMEFASYITSIIVVEQGIVDKGTIIVIPAANAASFVSTEDSFGYPGTVEVDTPFGTRWFRVASRLTNATSQWPDPKVYYHYPTGQAISGKQSRNLNRTYPGRPTGNLTEQISFAIMEIVRNEGSAGRHVDLFYDPHEAPPSRPLVDAMAVHQRAMDIATLAVMYMEMEGVRIRLEASPLALRGLTHREVGDHSDAFAVLAETVSGIDGPLRGKMTVDYAVTGLDPLKAWAAELGLTTIPYPWEGVHLDERVARTFSAMNNLVIAMGEFYPEREIVYRNLPSYAEAKANGAGYYLAEVPKDQQRAPFGIPAGRW